MPEEMGIYDLFKIIAVIFQIISKITYFGLTISSIIGHFIVKYIVGFFTAICTISETIFSVIKILYEDYCIFVLDVINKGIFLVYTVKSFVEYLIYEACSWWGAMKNLFANVYSFFMLCFDSTFLIITKIVHFISNIPEVLKNCIILVGSGIWLALKLIPLGVIYVFSMCILFVGRSFNELKSIMQSTAMGIINIVNKVITFLYDIPIEAQAGLILGTLLIYACTKYHTHIIQGMHYILEQIHYLLNCAWTALELFLFRIFTNQHHEPMNAEYIEHEGIVEETEHATESDDTDDENLSLNLRSRHITRILSPRKHSLVYEQENMLCVVCQDRDKCIIILPCRHLCLCSECSIIIQRQHGVCPICRENVRKTMKIYV